MSESTQESIPSSDSVLPDEPPVWWQRAFLPACTTVLLSLFHLAFVATSPLLEFLAVDLAAYDSWGRRLAVGDWLGSEVFYQDPLYPYLLGVLYRLLSPSLLWVFLLQIAAAAATVYLVHRIALALFSSATAGVAAWIMALYGPAIYFAIKPEKASLAAFGLTLMVYLVLRPASGRSLFSWLAAGFVCGASSLLRGNILLVGLVLGFLLIATRLFASSFRRRLAPAVALVFGLSLALLPVAVRNRVVGGEWILTTSQAGPNLFIGNHPGNRNGSYDPPSYIRPSPMYEREDFKRHAEVETGHSLSPSEVSSFYVHEVWDWAREEPTSFLALQAKKARVFMQAWEIPDNWSLYFVRSYSPILSLPLLSWAVVAPLALLGLAMALLSRRRPAIALSVLTLVYAASVIGFYVFSRYRFPLVPLACVLAARGLVELVCLARSRRWPALVLAGSLVGLGIATAQSAPTISPRVDLAHRHVNLASSFFLAGRLDEAEDLLDEAKELDSRSHGLWLMAARIADERGDLDREAICLQRARELAPDDPYVLAQSVRHLARSSGMANAKAFVEAELARVEVYLLRRTLAEIAMEMGMQEELGEQLAEILSHYPDDSWTLEQMYSLAVRGESWAKAAELASRLHSRTGESVWLQNEEAATSRLAGSTP